MSSGPARRVSPKDIQVVQNLIERCLQLYMNRREVVETLLAQAKIEPGFTELVWQKLEEENREFFKAYYLRLVVKHQILQFNKLLEQQVQLMHQMNLNSSIPHMPTSNGSHIPPLHQNPACYAPEHVLSAMKPESMHHTVGSSLQNAVTNGGSSLNSNIHTAVDMTIHANRLDVPPSMISTQSSNMGLMQGINGGMIKSEAGYSGTSQYILGADGGVLEARPIVDAPVASFGSVESNSQALNDLLLDADTPFGLLSNIPRNFSLSDIAAHFPPSSDLEAYSKSPFVTESETFLDLHEKDSEEDTKKLDTISEGMSYDDFGSE